MTHSSLPELGWLYWAFHTRCGYEDGIRTPYSKERACSPRGSADQSSHPVPIYGGLAILYGIKSAAFPTCFSPHNAHHSPCAPLHHASRVVINPHEPHTAGSQFSLAYSWCCTFNSALSSVTVTQNFPALKLSALHLVTLPSPLIPVADHILYTASRFLFVCLFRLFQNAKRSYTDPFESAS